MCLLSKEVRPAPHAVRLARAARFDEWISDDHAIYRIRMFNREKRQCNFTNLSLKLYFYIYSLIWAEEKIHKEEAAKR
jgi:hypothetical protein